MFDIQEFPVFKIAFATLVAYNGIHIIMPKSARYSLGTRIEDELLSVLTDIMEAGRVPKALKNPIIDRALRKNDTLKVLVRLADELSLAPNARLVDLQASLQNIGSQLGGWRRSSALANAP